MTLQNDTPESDGIEIIEVPYSGFLDKLAELELAGKRVAAMTVNHKHGKYRLTVIEGAA